MNKIGSFKSSPARILFSSIVGTIMVGAILLSLPFAQNVPISIFDNIFTATSATCVTGLMTIPIHNYSFFGHCIILCLIQIGGLGMITMTLFLVSFFVELGFGTQIMAGQLLELESWRNIKKILTFIISMTLALEASGTLLIWLSIRKLFTSLFDGIFISLFHAISAFCDAGFTLLPGGIIAHNHNISLLVVTTILMICGGLGFITFHELLVFFHPSHQRRRPYFSLQTRIILWTTAGLLCSSIVLFWLLEKSNAYKDLHGFTLFTNIFFNSVSIRSPGFLTIETTQLHAASILMIMIISFIGSSPGSTGSGIKTTTFALFLATVRAALSGHTTVSLEGRSIARDQIYKAVGIIASSIGFIAVFLFLLLYLEPSFEPFALAFEVFSAFATLGLSLNLTAQLSMSGKIIILCTMLIGRVGAFASILAFRRKSDLADLAYPEERVMVG